MATMLTIGNRSVSTDQATTWIAEYTSDKVDPKKPYGYPWYDTFDTGPSNLLVDGDLLAPVLLNVRPSIAAYAGLHRSIPALNAVLADISPTASLLSTADLSPIGRLYSILDTDRPYGVRATTLAKILHRKRPGLVPLYDREVRACYFNEHTKNLPRLTTSRTEPWSEFMVRVAAAIRDDILSAQAEWTSLATNNGSNPPIGVLRAFDIVAWRCGRATAPTK